MPDELQGDIQIEQTVISGNIVVEEESVSAPFQEARDAYQLAVANGYTGTLQEWQESLKGESIDLRLNDTHIQWKRANDELWMDLIAISAITGQNGVNPEFQVSATHVQWRLVGSPSWSNLIALSAISGTNGLPVDMVRTSTSSVLNSATGSKTFVFAVPSQNLGWAIGTRLRAYVSSGVYLEGTATAVSPSEVTLTADYSVGGGTRNSWILSVCGNRGSSGVNGAEVELQVNSTHIQWRYVGVATWTNLIALSSITGAPGAPGAQVEIQTNSTHIQWRYVGAATWTNLVALSAITGARGADGAGYYVPALNQTANIGVSNVTSLNIGNGYAYSAGARVRLTELEGNTYAEGVVSGYAGGVLDVVIDYDPFSIGSASLWSVNIAGNRGADGGVGPDGKGYYAYVTATIDTASLPASIELMSPGLAYVAGATVKLYSVNNPGSWISGVVTLYDPVLGTLSITPTGYSSSFSDYDWYLSVAGIDGTDASVTLDAVQGVMQTVSTNTSVANDDLVWVVPAAKTPGKWVPWLTGIVEKLKSAFVHLTGGQTIQSATATTTTLTLKAAASHNATYPLLQLVDSEGTSVAKIDHTGLLTVGTVNANQIKAYFGYPTGSIDIGADVNGTSRTNNVRKLGTVVSKDYTNLRVVELISFDSTSSLVNALSIGGRVGGSQYPATSISLITGATSATGGTTRLRVHEDGKIGIGIGTTTPSGAVHIGSPSQTTKGLIVQGAASQLSNLIEVQNSGGTTLFYVSSAGTVYSEGTIIATTGFQVGGTKSYTWDSRGVMSSPSDGVILFQNWATTDFSRLQFGGTSSSFPALKRNGSGLSVRTADDSADSALSASEITTSGPSSRMPNQLPMAYADSVMVREGLFENDFLPLSGGASFTRSLPGGRTQNFFRASVAIANKGVMTAFSYQPPGASCGRLKLTVIGTAGRFQFACYDMPFYAYGNATALGAVWNIDIRRAPDYGSAWVSASVTSGTPSVVAGQVITGSRGSQLTCRDTGNIKTSIIFTSVSGRLPSVGEVFTATGGTFTIGTTGAYAQVTDAQAAYTGLLIPAVGLFWPTTMPDGYFYINGWYIS